MAVSQPVDRFRRTLKSLNCDGPWGVALALSCLGLLATELGGDRARLALRYDRGALGSGEWWRLLTAHFVHLSLEHAVLNVLGLALIWALFARDYTPRGWLLILASTIMAIDLGLWLGDSTVQWYVGSSGALHGALAAGTLAYLRRHDPLGWVLALFLVGKLIYEQWVGALPLVTGGASVVVDAHLYGVLGGLIAALFLTPRREPL
ncbi:MAG TPA: rhombosortase [Steroidobacteraceae bacterium]|nr:rhombosortase [Steroidobacteraceae bacterium]